MRSIFATSLQADSVRPVPLPTGTNKKHFIQKEMFDPTRWRNWANLIKMSVSASVRRPLLGFVELRVLQTARQSGNETRPSRAASCKDA